jgi:aminotransferase
VNYRIADRIIHKDESIRTKMLGIAAKLEGVIALGRGDPDLPTPAHIIEAGQKALASGATHYTAPQGLLELRQAIAQKLRLENSLEYTPEEIIVTAGAQEGIYVAMLALLNPGDQVLAIPLTTKPSNWLVAWWCQSKPINPKTLP